MVTTSLAGSDGIGSSEGVGLTRDAGINLAVGEVHGELDDASLGAASSCADISGAAACVGPMMKLPSAFEGGTSPSGSSLAATISHSVGVAGWRRGTFRFLRCRLRECCSKRKNSDHERDARFC